jgi:hypothetical protein
MECSGLHNKPKAEVHVEHLLRGPKEEKEEISSEGSCNELCGFMQIIHVCIIVLSWHHL